MVHHYRIGRNIGMEPDCLKGGRTMITFDDVSFAYQGGIPDGSEPPALRHIHFHAERGECIVLCGKSGCGKTTMLRMVNGLVPHFYQEIGRASCRERV